MSQDLAGAAYGLAANAQAYPNARLSKLKALTWQPPAAVMTAAQQPFVSFSAARSITSNYVDIANSDPRITWGHSVPGQSGSTYPLYLYNTGHSVNYNSQTTNALSTNQFSIRLLTDSPAIEFVVGGYGPTPLQLLVDGALYSRQTIASAPNDGNGYFFYVNFGADIQNTHPAIAVTAGGSGYAAGDTLAVTGGTGTPPTLMVSQVTSGAVTQVTVQSWGTWTALPSGATATTTSGSGTGCTLTFANGSQQGHTTRKMRQIELIGGGGLAINGFRVGNNDTLRASPFNGPRLMVFGDSYVEGTGTEYPGGIYAARIAQRLGIDDWWTSGVGGTGFLAVNSPRGTYRSRIADIINYTPTDTSRPYLVVVQGSINDNGQNTTSLQTEVQAFWSQLFAALPHAYFVQTGVMRGPANNPGDTINTAVKNGFLAAQAIYDPQGTRSGWIETRGTTPVLTVGGKNYAVTGGGSTDYYTITDGTHPNQAMHDVLGDVFATDIMALIRTWTGG